MSETAHRYTYEQYKETADWLLEHSKHRPTIAMVCGSGLGRLADQITEADTFKYEAIPNFPTSTVAGHAGELVMGQLNCKTVIVMRGRFHMYEGYSLNKVTFPIRVFQLMGVTAVIMTNAAGSLNKEYKIGDIMVIKDHINLPGFAGLSPLLGSNEERFGIRFPSMSNAYDQELRKVTFSMGKDLGLSTKLHEGVYCCLGGPSYETIAECRFLNRLGGDAVGMSTAHEVVVARHCGIRVLGLSIITNEGALDYDAESAISHEEVIKAGEESSQLVQTLLIAVLPRIE